MRSSLSLKGFVQRDCNWLIFGASPFNEKAFNAFVSDRILLQDAVPFFDCKAASISSQSLQRSGGILQNSQDLGMLHDAVNPTWHLQGSTDLPEQILWPLESEDRLAAQAKNSSLCPQVWLT